MLRISQSFFQRDAVPVASQLIGARFLWDGCGGTIVETEAYRAEGDPACHTFFRKKAQQFVKDHPAGTAYVYLNYGVHWLFNVLTKDNEQAGFVLFRALAPEYGIPQMTRRRNGTAIRNLCSGPGKLTQALAITGQHHGQPFLNRKRSYLELPDRPPKVLADGRIGISRAEEYPWRFTSAHHQPWVSRPHQTNAKHDQ